MSGHSKWAKTHRQKSATDAKKGAVFTKLGNLITMAAKEGGSDLNSNFRLRLLLDKARVANMPKENIERAIKRGTGEGSEKNHFEELLYEIFGPEGSVFLVEAITDNKNRTVGELKTVANKNGGQLGGQNSVAWMFDRFGFVNIDKNQIEKIDQEELELTLIDAGATDIDKSDDWEILCEVETLQNILTVLKNKNIDTKESGIAFFAKNNIKIESQDSQDKIENFYNLIDDLDDISNVYTNATW
ncbi:MAG: YebC/PmpR family DNA-binding transcriptional regulator [Candidatus Buchananbacteria bacterium]